jgi:hypothetical protein
MPMTSATRLPAQAASVDIEKISASRNKMADRTDDLRGCNKDACQSPDGPPSGALAMPVEKGCIIAVLSRLSKTDP